MVNNKESFGIRNNLIPIEFLPPLHYKENGSTYLQHVCFFIGMK